MGLLLSLLPAGAASAATITYLEDYRVIGASGIYQGGNEPSGVSATPETPFQTWDVTVTWQGGPTAQQSSSLGAAEMHGSGSADADIQGEGAGSDFAVRFSLSDETNYRLVGYTTGSREYSAYDEYRSAHANLQFMELVPGGPGWYRVETIHSSGSPQAPLDLGTLQSNGFEFSGVLPAGYYQLNVSARIGFSFPYSYTVGGGHPSSYEFSFQIPEPSAGFLLGIGVTGLGLLIGLRRRAELERT